jgi:hypothetical protein
MTINHLCQLTTMLLAVALELITLRDMSGLRYGSINYQMSYTR